MLKREGKRETEKTDTFDVKERGKERESEREREGEGEETDKFDVKERERERKREDRYV